ncbi:hypothetical protein [Acetivibrio saccincola]|uniref:Uncharacterized protein n=1 Tax=Acetivibrio saccincola TaxID=1677857 RepID=A0A2S8R7C5_9FIRM|nr:hypothetical protein [Acetivibrio saccincola]PQQ65694.1 hypothetical protein B9R14_02190 [Acetivibrio saccincola]
MLLEMFITNYENDALEAISKNIDPDLIKQLDDLGIKPSDYDNFRITGHRTAETVAEIFERTGISVGKFKEILDTPKGFRPDPSTYLNTDYISSHLAKFEGGVTKITAYIPTETVGPPGGTFVMPKSLADEIIEKSGGNISKLEELLGLDPGTLGTNPVRIDILSPKGLRMPSGNELGASLQWLPGGYTAGGVPEATIDPAPIGTYIAKTLFN